jgi:glycerol-3-phosphate acyltransferase PlsY
MDAAALALATLAAVAVGYLLGSTPTGYLAVRWLKGIDLRQHGSGSTGATNAARLLGPGGFVAVLVLDALKGAAAVGFAVWIYGRLPAGGAAWTAWGASLAGLAAILGHARSLWLNFTGGKSVAAGLGVLLALAWPVGVGGFAAFALTVALTRIVSLGSLLAAVTAMVLVSALDLPLPCRLLVFAGGAYVILRHRANIQRLLAGTEPRLGRS